MARIIENLNLIDIIGSSGKVSEFLFFKCGILPHIVVAKLIAFFTIIYIGSLK